MSNGKAMIIRLIAGLIKKTLYKMILYFPKRYEPFGGDINAKVDLSNYVTKTDLEETTGNDMSNLAAKFDVASLKTVPVDLRKLSNAVNNEVV